MPFVDPAALTIRPQKILVAGTSGAGKTTLAGRIGRLLEIEHTELDSLFHGPTGFRSRVSNPKYDAFPVSRPG